jgi:uncharacterized membrane protein YbhN (UPF0104 family)
MVDRFWGFFGWYSVRISSVAIFGCTIVGVAVVAWSLASRASRAPARGVAAPGRTEPTRLQLLALVTPFVLFGAFVFQHAWTLYVRTSSLPFIQGRYLFGCITAAAVLAAVGAWRIVGRWSLVAIAALVTAVEADALSRIVSAYWGGENSHLRGEVRGMAAWSPWPTKLLIAGAVVFAGAIAWTAVEVVLSVWRTAPAADVPDDEPVPGPRPGSVESVPALEPDVDTDPELATSRTRSRTSRWSTLVGAVLGIVAMAFVVRTLWSDGPSVRRALDHAHGGWIVLGVALAAAGMAAVAVGWGWVLRTLGVRRSTGTVVSWYFVGELGKYLPGGVWPVVGRGELARRGGTTRSVAYLSVAMSLATLYLASGRVSIALLPFALGGGTSFSPAMLVLIAVPIGLVALHPRVLGRALDLARRVTHRAIEVEPPSWGRAVVLVVRYSVCWLLIGGSTWAIARALVPSASMPRVVFATVLSWLAGFIAVPVPAGAGIREAVLVAASGLAAGPAAATALISRLVFVVVDAAGALVGAGFGGVRLGRARPERAQPEPAGPPLRRTRPTPPAVPPPGRPS